MNGANGVEPRVRPATAYGRRTVQHLTDRPVDGTGRHYRIVHNIPSGDEDSRCVLGSGCHFEWMAWMTYRAGAPMNVSMS
jgi:hypothetical protein